MSFLKLYKLQLFVYFSLAALVGYLISIENGLARGALFSIGCFIFLTIISYLTYRNNLSKYGKRKIR